MDKNEIIERLGEIAKHAVHTIGEEPFIMSLDDGTAVYEAIDIIQQSQPQSHWIPCSERYPEQDERVLVTIGDYDFFVWDCMSNCGEDYFWEDEHGFYHNKYEVLAWMPLPEPYREGD